MKLPPIRPQRHLRRLLAHPLDALGLLAAIAYALPSLLYPFAGDQPIHWYLGVGILEGELPYVTGVSTKPPAAFLVHSFAVLLFGDHQWSIRVVDLLFVVGCAALIASFRTRVPLTDGRAVTRPGYRDGTFGAAVILTSGLYFTFFDWAATAHPELWQAFFMLASTWAVARAPGGRVTVRRALAAGALACVAVMFKHVAAIHGVVVGLAATLLALRHLGVRRGLAVAASFTGGVALVVAITVLPFVVTGHFDAFYEVMIEFILKYAEAAPTPRSVPPFFELDAGGLALVYTVAGLAAGVAVAARVRTVADREHAALIVASTIGALATVVIQGRPLASDVFSYQFIVCVPFCALAISWGVRQASPRARLTPVLLSVALIGVAFLRAPSWPASRPEWSFDREWESFLAYTRGEQTREEHLRPYGHAGRIDRYDTQERTGLEIRRRARPGDTLCVEGFATAIYAVAGLRCPSRHFAEVTAYEGLPEWMPEHRRVLRESPPTFVVTFPDRRARIRELEQLGYTRHGVQGAPLFVIMQRER